MLLQTMSVTLISKLKKQINKTVSIYEHMQNEKQISRLS